LRVRKTSRISKFAMRLAQRTFLVAISSVSCVLGLWCAPSFAAGVDLSNAVVVVRPGQLPNAEKTAATVLVEELEKRTGIHLVTSTSWPKGKTVIAITSQSTASAWPHAIPSRVGNHLPETRPEGYRLYVEARANAPATVWVIGADPRGVLFGVGQLLRRIDWRRGAATIAPALDISTAPAYPIRGHQLGYRAQANSYDAWNVAQFEQYIRELAFFGVNSIEAIPFQDERQTPVMKVSRREMNRAVSEICDRYGLDYWVWMPAEFDLNNTGLRAKMLVRYDDFFNDTKELTGIFFPGGDPGHNPPELVLPFLEDVAKRMSVRHPEAKIWISLQWFTKDQVDYVYRYIARENPAWFGGLVAGPSGPSIAETRRRLPKQYKLRLYPDITHNVRCQYQVPLWDQAFALTLGREAINPRPVEYAAIHNRFASYSDGFISYSDGVHDDVNKTIWSALSWDPNLSVRDILIDYARVYWSPDIAGEAADSILALEKNWRGPLIDNGSVEGTLSRWQEVERRAPQLENNWRWQMCLLRAYYDAYVRHRLINETNLETKANAILAQAEERGSDQAMADAADVLNRAVDHPVSPELRSRIVALCEALFHSIGLQTSVEKYYAIGEERGAVLDFVDYPLNNRWWLEDQFAKIRRLDSEAEKVRQLNVIATWEHPGRGSFYDDSGNIAKSPHVMDTSADGLRGENVRTPGFWWWDQGKSRARLSWQTTMWPRSVVYEGLDPNAAYVVRSTGYGQALLRVDGDRVEPTITGKQMGEISEFPVPAKCLTDEKIVLTWDPPTNEESLNWRQRSRLAEIWLIKQPTVARRTASSPNP
jgi:hypothetical protein